MVFLCCWCLQSSCLHHVFLVLYTTLSVFLCTTHTVQHIFMDNMCSTPCTPPHTQYPGGALSVFPMLDVCILTPDHRPAPPNQPGEIAIRGPTVMQSYLHHGKQPGAHTDGWFFTGDVGMATADGRILVVDRVKDMVLVGGENVYSSEVESVLLAHPAVAEAAVVGVPHPVLGETVGACVVLVEGVVAPGSRALMEWCGGQLAGYKVPALVMVCASLPKTG